MLQKLEMNPLEGFNIFKSNRNKNNYELNTLEFINSSILSQRYGLFESPICESHGECDATCYDSNHNVLYELDFKLFISKSEGSAFNELLPKVIEDENNEFKLLHPKKNISECYKAIDLLKNLESNEIDAIINKTFMYIDSEQKKNYENCIKTLLTNKNIFYVLPYYIYLNDNKIDDFIELFNYLYKNIFSYREKKTNLDSYFSFFVNKSNKNYRLKLKFDLQNKTSEMEYTLKDSTFVILEYKNNNLVFLDEIDVSNSNNFCRYYNEPKVLYY